ncbi:uncharacterized protein TNCV_2045611 [Trichonephila clavipes]|nr:uncharacterized protein TNCV_2045611 [Trichonephila clavipes]
MQKGQEETKQEMQKCQQEMQKSLDHMQRSQEETKQEMQKGLENVQKCQEELKNSLEEKINSVEDRIAGKLKEEITVVEDKMGKEIEKIKEQVEERIEGVAENFSLISQRMVDLEKKLLAGGNENKSKSIQKLSTYDGKTNWEVNKTQFSIISEANGWTEGVKASQLAAFLRGEAAEILQTLPNTERLNLNSLYNALDLRFGQKYSKEYARLQMKTRLQKTGESSQEYASEVERLANLAFSDHPATVRETISLQYFVDGLKEGEIQKAVRMADVQDLKSALLYALKLEAATQVSRRDHQSIRGARVTLDAPCESP